MRKFLKTISNLKLTLLLILSVVVISLIGIYYSINEKVVKKYSWSHPFLVSFLLQEKPEVKKTPAPVEVATVADASPAEPEHIDITTYPGRAERPMEYENVPKFEPRSPYYIYTGKKALTTTYPYVDAGPDYFKDTLFIGDSRIEGLFDFGNIPEADFCFRQGVSVFNIMGEDLNWGDKGSGTLGQLLKKYKYKKIYIMLGVNELGTGYAEDYADQYNMLIKYIHDRQENVIITVMGIMNVTKEYSDSSEVFNLDNINARNSLVAGYINGYDTFYLDVNPAVSDKNGALNAAYTNDGIHLSAEYYEKWVDFIKKHALQEDLWK